MAATTITTEAALSREQLRTFHLTGLGSGDDLAALNRLRPTALGSLALPALESFFPMFVKPDGAAQPLLELVKDLEHASIIPSAFRTVMNGQASMFLEDAAQTAIDSLVECSPQEIGRLRKLLPANTYLAAFHAWSPVLLHAAALGEARQAQRAKFWADIRHTAARLKEILALDEAHGSGTISVESVSASLGSQASAFFQPEIIAKALQSPKQPLRRMDAERRSRCETTLAMLQEGLQDAADQPAFWLFHSGIFGGTSAPSDVLLFRGDARFAVDSFAAALQFTVATLDRFTHLLRALRVARLEIDSTFHPQVHEEMLARFDWQSAGADELYALPPVMVAETADYFSQASLSSFGQLLRSGLPVQILVLRGGIEPQDLTSFMPDFGYVSIAHRESFVLQSSLAAPAHLLGGLKAMAKTLRPAVAVVSAPPRAEDAGTADAAGAEKDAWLVESLLVLARTFPLYTYDPDAGARWADRFHLAEQNPARSEAGREDLTAAHAAAVTVRLRNQFRVIAADQWNSEQMELAQYLEAYTDRPPLAVPYIWVEGPKGAGQRALLTRDLANLCRDRKRAYALFEELAGVGQHSPAADPNARQQGAREAIQRVIAMLAEA